MRINYCDDPRPTQNAINIHVLQPNLNEMPLKLLKRISSSASFLMHFNLIVKNALAGRSVLKSFLLQSNYLRLQCSSVNLAENIQ